MDYVLLLVVATAIFQKSLSRKYDIGEESVKLYGEDVKSVLKKFRRTPEYLKILNDKVEDMEKEFMDILKLSTYHYDLKMKEKIVEIIQGKSGEPVDKAVFLRQLGDQRSFVPRQRRYRVSNYRQGPDGNGTEEQTESPIARLDKYDPLKTNLTVQERNMFRDLAYDITGQAIHTTIRLMGDEDFSERSTKQPYGGDNEASRQPSSTTEHVHEILTKDASTTHSPASERDDTYYRVKVTEKKKNHKKNE